MDKWPQSDRLTVAPIIDRSFLSRTDLVTDESRAFSVVVLDNTPCGTLSIEWRHMDRSNAPLPAELPAEMRASLEKETDGMTAEERQRRHDDLLDRYQQSKAIIEKGEIDVRMAVAPSSRAAQEWLVFVATECALPTEALVERFDPSKQVVGLGDVAFKGDGYIMLARGNVAVIVQGRGDCISEVDQLARKIDAAIAKEPVMTTLQAGRPVLAGGSLGESAIVPGQMAYSYTATAPGGHAIAVVYATVNGKQVAVKNGEVLLGTMRGQLGMRITAITDRLMVASIDKNVVVDAK